MMSVQSVISMCVACLFWLRTFSVEGSESVIYRHVNSSAPCDYDFYPSTSSSRPALFRIGCGAACHQAGCGYFQYQNGLCSLGQMGTMPVAFTNRGHLYVRLGASPPSLTKQQLDVIGKPAYSDIPFHYPMEMHAGRAVDGNVTALSYFHSLPHHTNPWWVLDLEAEYFISEVEIQPDTDRLHFFRSIEVRASKTFDISISLASRDFSSWNPIGFYIGKPTSQDPVIFSCANGVLGRYISVQCLETGDNPYFSITEVWVKIYV